jgi:hypothetical protein
LAPVASQRTTARWPPSAVRSNCNWDENSHYSTYFRAIPFLSYFLFKFPRFLICECELFRNIYISSM